MHIAVLSPQSPLQPSSSAVARLEMFQEISNEHTVDYYYFGEIAKAADISIGAYQPEGHPGNFSALRKLLGEISRKHRSKPYDIVWTTLPPIMMALFAVQVKKKLRIPLVVDVRDPGISSARLAVAASHPKYKAAWLLERRIYRNANAICCTTAELCEFLAAEFSIPRDRFTVVSNASLKKEKNPNPYTKGTFEVFFAGTFAPYQVMGPFLEKILDAKDELATSYRFTLYGYEERGAELPALIKRHGAESFIHLQGKVPREQAMQAMESAHAVLVPIHGLDMPELYDYAVPLKYYEALAQSKPILLFGGTKAVVQSLTRDKAGVRCTLKGNLVQALRDLSSNYATYQAGANTATYLRSSEAKKVLAVMKELCTSRS